MTRYGIGPKIMGASVLYGLVAGWLTHLYPDRFLIEYVPYWLLAVSGGVLSAVGIVVYIKTLRFFLAGTEGGQLLTDGAFSVVRHPLYAAWIGLIIPGVVLFFRSWLILVVPFVSYVAFVAFIREEEDYLRKHFGKDFLEYRSRVCMLFPLRLPRRSRSVTSS